MNERTIKMAIVLVVGMLIGAGAAYWMLRGENKTVSSSTTPQTPQTMASSSQQHAATQPTGEVAGTAAAAPEATPQASPAPTPVPDTGANSPDGSRVAFAGDSPGAAAPAAGGGSAESSPSASSGTSSAVSSAAAAASDLAKIVPNSELKGRLGRIVVKFPAGALDKDTPVKITRADSAESIKSFYGSNSVELMPGAYTVLVNNKAVPNLQVQSKSDTIVSLGVLKTSASKDTHITLLDSDGKTQLTSGYGDQQWGLPPGKYFVKVAGSTEPVEIKADQVTEF